MKLFKNNDFDPAKNESNVKPAAQTSKPKLRVPNTPQLEIRILEIRAFFD